MARYLGESMFGILAAAMMLAAMSSAQVDFTAEELAEKYGAKRVDFLPPPSGEGSMEDELAAIKAKEALNAAKNGSDIHTTFLLRRSENPLYRRDELEDVAFAEDNKSSRIIRGKVVYNVNKAPYVASVYSSDFGFFYSFICTASVVDNKVLLSAAHCIEFVAFYTVCVSSVISGRGRCFDLTNAWLPTVWEDSDLNGDANPWTHDIALFKTEGNMLGGTSKAKIVPVDLAPTDISFTGRRGYIYGFGTKNEAGTALDGRLRILDVFWQKFNRCRNDSRIRMKNFLCGNGNYDGSRGATCVGDSGGPMVWSRNRTPNPTTHVQVGITSFGYVGARAGSCSVTKPAGFSWVASPEHSIWLRAVMRDLANGQFTIYKRS